MEETAQLLLAMEQGLLLYHKSCLSNTKKKKESLFPAKKQVKHLKELIYQLIKHQQINITKDL